MLINSSLIKIAFLALLPAALYAEPVGAAFTFQGRLPNNAPANGTVPMNFSLWNAASGGNNVGKPLSLSRNVTVANRVFTVDLDFGTAAFTGDARWLQTERNGVVDLQRIRVAPTPNALYASLAGTVANSAIRANQLGTVAAPSPGQVLGYNGSSLVWQSMSSGGTGPFDNLVVNGDGTFGRDLSIARDLRLGGATSEADLGVFSISGWAPVGVQPPTRFIVRREGTVGIGVAMPQAALDVRGNWEAGKPALQLGGQKPSLVFAGDGASGNRSWLIHNGGNGPGNLEFYDRAGSADWRPVMSLVSNSQFLRVEGGGEAAYIGGDGVGGEVHVGSLNPSISSVAIFNSGGQFWMDLSVRSLTILGGADLAEPFPMSEQSIPQGSVVVIDDANPGQLKLSERAYDTRVAGIVSGANGIKPGIALKQEGSLDQGQNVALTGRVYVQADASFGAIKPGDLLTTSDTPGRAMKVSDSARAQGAVLGKAMTSLVEGKGMVLVLVTLQ